MGITAPSIYAGHSMLCPYESEANRRPRWMVDTAPSTCAGHDISCPYGREYWTLLHDYPTLPSRLTLRSFWASTANSMGSSLKTRLQKPLTIMETASSAFRPRWRK